MTTALAIRAPQDEAEWLTHSLPSLRSDPAIRERAAQVVAYLSAPAPTPWTMARVAALLSPYYDKEMPQAVRMMEAEDWAEALSAYPQWAIEKAVRWWKSEHNSDRRKRPMEGDIAARCKVETQAVRAAKIYLASPPTPTREEVREEVSPEERARVSAKIQAIIDELAEKARA